jgi:hypothetical protein
MDLIKPEPRKYLKTKRDESRHSTLPPDLQLIKDRLARLPRLTSQGAKNV